jgi:hypothetical protein
VSSKKIFSEQDVIRLLNHWKERKYPYSSVLQSKRRSAFLAASASLLLYGAGKAIGKSVSWAGHADVPMTIGMKITLGILTTAILAISTYLGLTYYEDIVTLIDQMQGDSTPTLVVPSPVPYSTEPNLGTISPTITGSPTSTITSTPIPAVSTNGGGNQPIATSTPTKPGNHYGQTKTPKPKRTPLPK